MISNHEFIKTQSFEVAWAVFRCAELFSQADLRKNIEAAAVDLIAGYDAIGESMEGESPRIEKLISFIRLAESVGQIASVNANVLYRELDNLAKAARLEAIERRNKKNIAVSLENIFTNSAYAKNLARNDDEMLHKEGAEDVVNSAIDKSAEKTEMQQFGNIESLLSAAAQSRQPIIRGVEQAPPAMSDPLSPYIKPASAAPMQNAAEPQVRQSTDSVVSASIRQTDLMPESAPSASVATPLAGSWQHVILRKVTDLKQTTTKELTASFPEISERTIRFYLQKLVDANLIDRIGSTGPGAAYKAK